MPAFFIVLHFVAAASIHAFPRIDPDPFFSSLGEAVEPLDVEALIDTALRASGATEAETLNAKTAIVESISRLRSEVPEERDGREKAEYVLQFLHEHHFRYYDEYQTRVDMVISDGGFNCVSSAVLYMIFSRSVGVPVIGIGTPDHAFCAAVLSEGNIDVETTSSYGFDPGKKKEFHDAFGNVTGYSYVPPSAYAARSELSERELIALILQNRISMLESGKRYDKALELAADRYAMAPGDSTGNHLFRGAINYAALLNERKEYSEALEFLTGFINTYGWNDSVREIFGILHYNRVVVLIQSEAFEEAIEAMNELEAPGWIDSNILQDLRAQVAERIIAKQLPALTPEAGFKLLDALRDDGLLSSSRYTDFAVMIASNEADAFAAAGEFLQAATIIERAIEAIGADRRLESARAAYRYNFAVDAHNTFAALFNGGEYDAARRLLEEAIEKVPDSDILQKDLRLLEKRLQPTD